MVKVDSPSKSKIKLLSEKWNNVENGLEREKSDRRGLLEEKFKQIEERLTKERPTEESKFKANDKNKFYIYWTSLTLYCFISDHSFNDFLNRF